MKGIQAEESVRLSEEKFSKSFENAPLIMSITSMEDGTFLDVNSQFLKVSGFSREESIGKTSVDLGWISAADRKRIVEKYLHEGRVSEMELNTRSKTGNVVTCIYYGELITMDGHQRILSVCLDVTRHKQLEEQLRQAQKMESIGQLAGGVAHDFNNILTVILGYSNFLKMDKTLSVQQQQNIDQIVVAAEKAAQLTSGLLAFSRKQVMDMKVLNLNEVVQHVQKFLVRIIGEDVHLKIICNEVSLKVKADSSQIEQVLINLATNARDAMPGGGLLSIETGFHTVDRSLIKTNGFSNVGKYAYISVADTGTGMDEETRKRIFEPFFTTKEMGKGTGLGMAIVHGIINQHEGFIEVSSEPGKGTEFRIYLPVIGDGGNEADQPAIALPPPKGGHETILVAEDDTVIRDLVAEILKEFGYTVIVAVDGEDAVDKFTEHKDTIKLVVMDVIMPKKSGKEASKEIRMLQPDVKVLYASGYTMDIIKSKGELEEGAELIMKPIRPLELLRKVRGMLDSVVTTA